MPRYRQSAWLADAMKLSYSQAHRRLTGASIWTLEDLAQVAELLGESLAQLVTLQPSSPSVAAVMRVGAVKLDCQLWLGDVIEQPATDSLVAVRTSNGWAALVASEATDGAMYQVERLEARPATATAMRKTIAVLDDDQDLTLSVCAHLDESGFTTRPFYRSADLLASALAAPHVYDGYVLDWIVGDASTSTLIAALREQNARAPILVLTAQMLSGRVDESEIADAVKAYDLIFSEKPIRMPILSASLTRAFLAAAPSPPSVAPDSHHANLP